MSSSGFDDLPPGNAGRKRASHTANAAARHRTPRPKTGKEQGWCFRNWTLMVGIQCLCLVGGFFIAVVITPNDYTSNPITYINENVDREHIREFLQSITDEIHIAGTAQDYATAEQVMEEWRVFGIPAVHLEEFEVLLNYPLDASLKLLSVDPVYEAPLTEPAVDGDATSSKETSRGFHGYSRSGSATAPLVYANYGREEDFQRLDFEGISVNGTIVICRYGRIFRGNKVEGAMRRGAVGVVIYSDPADDGNVKGDVYPEGPWRPSTGIQRGSVYIGEGDPLTPGWASVKGARKLTMEEARTDEATGGWPLPLIPSLPISYGAAEPLLAALRGRPVADFDPDWQGGLDFDYHVGVTDGADAEAAIVELVNNMQDEPYKPIWNVIGRLQGSEEPDREVIIGNHRDAWQFGAVDPGSGSAVLQELARLLGRMYKNGWRPRRTVVLCSWDAEEYALVGSTEHVELNAAHLTNRAVAYINLDVAVESPGSLVADATPSLTDLVLDVARSLEQPASANYDPAQGLSVYDYMLLEELDLNDLEDLTVDEDDGSDEGSDEGYKTLPEPTVGTLGSGSDFCGFQQHLGIPSISVNYGARESEYGVYHSIYDSYHWMEQFGDPLFLFHASMTQIVGGLAMRLANDPVLPFNYLRYSRELYAYIEAAKHAAGGNDGVGQLDFSLLEEASLQFEGAAINTEALAVALRKDRGLTGMGLLERRQLNDRLMLAERAFVVQEGLTNRPWFKHTIFSPSSHNAYAGSRLPALTDAIAVGDWDQAQIEIDIIRAHIQSATLFLEG